MDKRRFEQRLSARSVPTCLKQQVSNRVLALDSIAGSLAGLSDGADSTRALCLGPNHYGRRRLEILRHHTAVCQGKVA